MRSTDKVSSVAVVCADIHLSLKPPISRAGEVSWFAAMKRTLDQLRQIAEENSCPIICAGDVFDRWNSPPELINFALEHLPKMYAIPGQHDLPLHDLDQIKRSAYWTLVQTKVVTPLLALEPTLIDGVSFQGFAWGEPIVEPLPRGTSRTGCHVAVVHAYTWIDGCSYPSAPKEMNANQKAKAWAGYDTVIFGDNHKGFSTIRSQRFIFNCGSLMRRKSDQIFYRPQVGLLLTSGVVKPIRLDVEDDIIEKVSPQAEIKEDLELQDFLKKLGDLEDQSLDFVDALKRVLDTRSADDPVRRIILEALGDG